MSPRLRFFFCLSVLASLPLTACGSGDGADLGESTAPPWQEGGPSGSSSAGAAGAAGAAGQGTAASAGSSSSQAGGGKGDAAGAGQGGGSGDGQQACVKSCEQIAACDGSSPEICPLWCAHHYELDAGCTPELDAMFSCFVAKVPCLSDYAQCADEMSKMQACGGGCDLLDVLHVASDGCKADRSCGGKSLQISCHSDASATTCSCLVDGNEVGSCQSKTSEVHQACDFDLGCCSAFLYGP